MAILGTIIKGFIDVKEKLTGEVNHLEAQEKVLSELLDKAKNTLFGKYYQFDRILDSGNRAKHFASQIPFFDYNRMNEEWWEQLHQGKEDVTWPGNPLYFALSSGTTGKTSKRIPVTDDMLDCIVQAGIKQVFSLSNFDLPADFFEKEILMLGSSTNLQERNNHLEGEISGISASNIPIWFRRYYKPGMETAKIDDWDKKVAEIVKNAPDWDIGALSGIPSWMELMLQKVLNYYQLQNIHEIWPNLQVYTSGGVAFGPYEKSFNALMGKPVTVIDTYFASEGFIAFQARPDTTSMQLITDNGIYFEFVPFKPEYINPDGSVKDNIPVVGLKDVELNQDYILIISTVAGTWRYVIGDTIAFTNLEKAEIIITGRTKFFLNTVGSQLSVNKLNDAVKHIEDEFSLNISEYTLCAQRIDGEFYHSWYLGTENKLNEEKVANALDRYLSQANKNYKVARSKALKGLKVNLVSPTLFYNWNAQNKKMGGQVKMERVMSEDKFNEWENFVAKNM